MQARFSLAGQRICRLSITLQIKRLNPANIHHLEKTRAVTFYSDVRVLGSAKITRYDKWVPHSLSSQHCHIRICGIT